MESDNTILATDRITKEQYEVKAVLPEHSPELCLLW